MLQLSEFFVERPVLSLRSGDAVATASQPIINPDNLKIMGFHCQTAHGQRILLTQDVRQYLADGLVVDDYERLAEPDELVRLQKILDINFSLPGKQVVTIDKHKLGKVSDYAVDVDSMYIQKIYVSQSVLKSLTGGSLSIDRSQVHETTPHKIVVTELNPKNPLPAAAPAAQ